MSLNSRSMNSNMTLFGVVFILVSLTSLIYIAHKTHETLEETRSKLGESQSKLLSLSRQFDSLYEYKTRIEKAFIDLKSEKASMIQMDQKSSDDHFELKTTYEKQLKEIQIELKSCQTKLHREQYPNNDQVITGLEFSSQNMPNLSSPLARHINSYFKPSANDDGRNAQIDMMVNVPSDVVHGTSGNAGQVNSQAPQPSGDPNEDPAGNVFI